MKVNPLDNTNIYIAYKNVKKEKSSKLEYFAYLIN